MIQITIDVPGNPIPQGSMTTYGGKTLHHSNKKLEPWREKVHDIVLLAARQKGINLPVDEPVEISAVFRLPKPKRPKFNTPATKPDLDKLQRAIGDALSPSKGVKILQDDSRIISWIVEKRYAISSFDAGVLINIEIKEA